MPQSTEPNYRSYGVLLTVGAGVALFAIGFLLQDVVYALRSQYQNSGVLLPRISEPLFDWFGLRPTSFVLQMTFWFWWPFLANLLHTACYYPENGRFARVFGFRFLGCCVVVACYLSVVGLMATMPRVILLADLEDPPAFTRIVPIVSWILPITLAFLAVYWVYRTSKVTRDVDGAIRIVHASEKEWDRSANNEGSEPADAPESPIGLDPNG